MVSPKKEIIDLTIPQAKKVVSVDCGTMNLVLAQPNDDKSISLSTIRNMYLPLDKSQLAMAELSNLDYVESDDKIYIIGEHAYRFANIFGQAVKRPMSKGLISPNEIDGVDVLALIMKKLVGTTNHGFCMYSIPAPSVDVQNNIVYHEGLFKRIFTDLGYVSKSMNEALAIIYSQCQEDNFTALSFSFGAGMVNCCLAYRSVPVLSFSVARSGDWIDEQTALSLGTIPSRVTAIKENETDLANFAVGPKKERRIREAIVYYYREMMRYSLQMVKDKLSQTTDNLQIPESLAVIVAGGSSIAKGFIPLFTDTIKEYEDDFPFKVKEIRSADDPLGCVAEGLLIKALMENKEVENPS